MTFDIRDYIDRLNVVKETTTEYHCKCPICNDGGFKIQKNTGAYKAFKCEHNTPDDRRQIRDIVAPIEKKEARPRQTRKRIYCDRSGNFLVQVVRTDDGNGGKKVFQKHWNGSQWVKGTKGVDRANIPIYERSKVREAIADGKPIFIVEGEPCADALWELGLAATTNIGGALKWHDSDTEDLEEAKTVVLCPDRDRPGVEHMERVEAAIANRFPDIKILWYYPPFQSGWNWIPKDKGLDVADYIADYGATADDILGSLEPKRDLPIEKGVGGCQQGVGQGVGSSNADVMGILEAVSSVNSILDKMLTPWQELHELEEIRARSPFGKAVFEALVSEERAKRTQVLPEDVDRLKDLMGLGETHLDLRRVLPQLAEGIYYDARQIGCAPEFIWQNLIAAVASLIGPQVSLRVGSRITPAILYLANVGESGIGKTQAMNLVYEPLRRWQESARQGFEERATEYELTMEQWKADLKKAIGDGATPPEKPELEPERKYLMQSFSIWAVLQRLKEQSEQGNGFVLARDELKAIFAFNQFSKNDTEGLELIIEQWDGNSLFLDRKNAADGFYIPASRMSIVGGIQPGIFRKVFKDPDDAQGVQARFLFAVDDTDYDEEEGACCLASTDTPGVLEQLYQQLQAINNWPEVQLSDRALERWKTIKKSIKKQAADNPHAAIRAWLRKLPAQILRIALVLHVLDCVYNPALNRDTISLDVMNRAIDVARYYKSCFLSLQETAANTTDVASVMFQILDMAKRAKKGLTPRSAYRNLRSLGRLARIEGAKVGEFTTNLFYRLSEAGMARIEKSPQTIRLFVNDTTAGNGYRHGNGNGAVSVNGVGQESGKVDDTADTWAKTQSQKGFQGADTLADTRPTPADTFSKVGHNGHRSKIAETFSITGFQPHNGQATAIPNSAAVADFRSSGTADTPAQMPSQPQFRGADTFSGNAKNLAADTSVAVADGECSSHIGDGHGLSTAPRSLNSSGSTPTTAGGAVAQPQPTAIVGAELSGGTGLSARQQPGTVRPGDREVQPHGTPGNAQDGDDRGVSFTSGVHGNSNSDLAVDAASSNGKTEAHTEAKNGTETEDTNGTETTESPIQWVKSRDRRLPEHLREMPLKITQVRSPKRIEVRASGDTKYHTIPLSSCYSVSRHPDGLYDTYESYGT